MISFDLLLVVSAAVLGLSAVALGTASRLGATRALAVLLGVNALLVTRALAWTIPALAPLQSASVGVVALALFALSPPLLALAILRAGTHGPLRKRDGLAALPFVIALVALLMVTRAGAVSLSTIAEIVYVAALNGVALASFIAAAVWVGRVPRSLRVVGSVVVGVFVLHWLWSAGSWIASLAGASAEVVRALEVFSVGTLLAFGVGAAWLGLRRLPAALPAPAPAPDPGAARADAWLAARVSDALESDERYLDPQLTVEALADVLRAPTRDVSRVLGTHLGGGFHDVVGRLRVAEARRLLLAEPEATVLDILYRSGFNSKSAFHRAFRQHVGVTPSAFRRSPSATLPPTASGDGASQDPIPAVPLPVLGRRGP